MVNRGDGWIGEGRRDGKETIKRAIGENLG